MNKLERFKQLKNVLMFEAEKEKEIRTDIVGKINRNSLQKHDHNSMVQNHGEGKIL